jgi:hypothetical protein
MSPLSQGYESTRTFPECTWVPKPVNSQALKGFPTPTTIQVPSSLVPSLYCPKRMDLHPSLPRIPLGSPSPLFWGLQHSWSRISKLELSGLSVVRKMGHMPTHLRHVDPRSWLDCTSDHYSQLFHG